VDSSFSWSSFGLVFSKSVINRFSDISRILRYYKNFWCARACFGCAPRVWDMV